MPRADIEFDPYRLPSPDSNRLQSEASAGIRSFHESYDQDHTPREVALLRFDACETERSTAMKTIIQIVFVMSLLAAATSVQADPPPGVGSADVTITKEGACLGAFVDVGGASTPILPGGEGLVFVNLEEVVLVYANDRNGNAHLRCHGRIPVGETVLAFDFVTGEEILATLPTVNGACAAIELVFPEACRGRGAIIFNFETTGAFCTIGGVPTPDWHQVTTRNGAANLSCHIGP